MAAATTTTTSIKLDPEMKERVRQLAEAQRRSAHWIMKEAIEEYVERAEKEAQFRRDAIAAADDYEETGLHLTGPEVDAWLARLERGEEAPMPKWHK